MHLNTIRTIADVVIWRTPQDKADRKAPLIVVECKADNVTIKPADYGTDANDRMARTSKMNMILHNVMDARIDYGDTPENPKNVQEGEG